MREKPENKITSSLLLYEAFFSLGFCECDEFTFFLEVTFLSVVVAATAGAGAGGGSVTAES